MLRIVIAAPDEALIPLLADVIGPAQGLEVVGTALDGQSALEVVHRTHPDVVVVDVDIVMPPHGGLTLVAAITAASPGTVVLVLASDDLEETVRAALAAGAAGVLAKDGSAQFPPDLWSDPGEDRATRSVPETGDQWQVASETAPGVKALTFAPRGRHGSPVRTLA